MTIVTRDPRGPYRAVEQCLGHAFGYATTWTVVDSRDHLPIDLLPVDQDTVMDEAWCKAQAERLNAAHYALPAIGLCAPCGRTQLTWMDAYQCQQPDCTWRERPVKSPT